MTIYSQKILIVDDRPENLLALENLLEELNLNILKATSGNETLKIAAREHPALILLDVMMPEMDGFETAELLRKDSSAKFTPIIFITAMGTEKEHIFKGYKTGAVDYLLKPINPDILLSKVRIFLELDRHRWELRNSEETARALLNASLDSAILIETDGTVLAANEIAARRLNKKINKLVGTSLFNTLPSELAASRKEKIEEAVRTSGPVRFEDQHGEIIFDNHIYPVRDSNNIVTRLAVFTSDITKRRRAEKLLERMAKHDQLTGLANRMMFSDFQAKAMARAKRYHRTTAVLFLDLDHFKKINDNMGHDAGDKLLKSVTKRVSRCVRTSDMVARLGGDEFGVILDDIARPEDAARIAGKILDALTKPHRLAGQDVVVSSSIGIAIYSGGNESPEDLNRAADTAMYHAKKAGRNNYQFFVPKMHEKILKRVRFETDLRKALNRWEFQIHYQPQIDIRTTMIVGFEALLRWQHHNLGIIHPAGFIRLAEDSSLIIPIGEWVLGAACADCMSWQANSPETGPITVAVNVSSCQIRQKRFWETVDKVLTKTGLPPDQLEIELTENALMEDPERAIMSLDRIRRLGVRIAIDDFGSGYSSLHYLKQLPIDAIKIDISFIRDIGKNKNNEAIIKTIISLARNLGLRVVAEGVETAGQAAFLRPNHCNLMQGYYFSRPLNHMTAGRLLAAGL
ncbi:MAG: EAL domain-containing protein [Desulfobulbaceae bacterium]|nr:EAL domain-containing protein [Desulfobulbaceae bacterium]